MTTQESDDREMVQVPPGTNLLELCGIYLFTDTITNKTCSDAIRFILESNLNSNRLFDKIQFIINTSGGDLESTFALTDVMQGSKLPVYTTGIGLVASAGLLVFMAGKKGHRVITPNTMLLSHQWSWSTDGKEHELLASVRAYELIQKRVINHYKRFTGLSEKKIKQYLLPPSDMWISVEDAVKLNMADKIVNPVQQFDEVLS